jgi:hypothetical protein
MNPCIPRQAKDKEYITNYQQLQDDVTLLLPAGCSQSVSNLAMSDYLILIRESAIVYLTEKPENSLGKLDVTRSIMAKGVV